MTLLFLQCRTDVASFPGASGRYSICWNRPWGLERLGTYEAACDRCMTSQFATGPAPRARGRLTYWLAVGFAPLSKLCMVLIAPQVQGLLNDKFDSFITFFTFLRVLIIIYMYTFNCSFFYFRAILVQSLRTEKCD